MRTGIIFFCAAVFLVAGCAAELPRPAPVPYSSQRQLQSATDWQRIAKLVKDRLSSDPALLEALKPDSSGLRPRIHVQTSDQSPFGDAFRNYLITELIDAHFPLSDTPGDASVKIRWDYQLITRYPERLKPLGAPEYVAGAVWRILSGRGWNTSGIMTPHTELLLTTRVTGGGDSPARIIKGYSDTFYINDGDWDNYNYQPAVRSIAAQDEAWRKKFERQGLLSR